MMKNLAIAAVALLAMTACSKSNTPQTETGNTAAEVTATPAGEWAVTAIGVAEADMDTVYTDPACTRLILSADSTFHMSTNCNSIEGSWVAVTDSIMMSPMLMTEMACDDMHTEQAAVAALPKIATYAVTDSTLTLKGGDDSTFITLVKVADQR